ncbi:MAG: protein kinase, partial [Lentisphaeraceae bacterium]|nr:protein kinase [Lentisphaeraceae bacterium]
MKDDSIEINEDLSMHYERAKLHEDDPLNDVYKNQRIISENSLLDELKHSCERYRYGAEIARGAVKIIYEAQDKFTTRQVAIATLNTIDSHLDIENFLREARLTASLQHPNIIPVYNIGLDDEESPFFSMKLIEGESLQAIIKKLRLNKKSLTQKYDLRQRLDIFLKVCDAMTYAHSKNIIHLDLKPANIQ